MRAQVLNNFIRSFEYETFDATNQRHLEAYACLQQYGRQHPTLRFNVEPPYDDVLSMMKTKIADTHIATQKYQHQNIYANAIILLCKASPVFNKQFGFSEKNSQEIDQTINQNMHQNVDA